MWARIGEALVVIWLVVATTIFVVVFVRRVRANGFPEPSEDVIAAKGGIGRWAPLPRPEWTSWPDDPDNEDATQDAVAPSCDELPQAVPSAGYAVPSAGYEAQSSAWEPAPIDQQNRRRARRKPD